MIGRISQFTFRKMKVKVVSDEPIDFFKNVEFEKLDLTIYENCFDVRKNMDYVFHVSVSRVQPRCQSHNHLIIFYQ